MIGRIVATGVVLAGLGATPVLAQSDGWEAYQNAELGYRIELPTGVLDGVEVIETDAGVTLTAIGPVQIDVLGSANMQGFTPDEFSATIEAADGLREVTYRASGNSWFVLSGFLRDDAGTGEELIFYTKYLFNADRSAVSAFEVSYPASEKARLDPVVTRIEKSLRSPA
ncbi:hypothetical protein EMQ25_07805 [Arsenicitalea aurantiaca]|uniref:Uncharacterized protein n=1 Tax=Arsenicitalea aurantiaca TaxID=1783274 RepID=A0A433XFY9_9HYPH|nr:hypothetical protein [Arsenicitalea aurantiaca]RUT33021.1 hypothetical protein EMQ25_07805 [Arsenicitalea aurantiaca]